ncbi:polysaccharide deacetylase family protein [Saccharospirillum impatiens]|uniref:polysaccharide deacetylase family protein n=1 Tax=Saccharospirillum impatiens TaxID=169438 RepID=UPI00040DF2FE|nr:polysaccharide deacetylase family protein [Saccharospirillum impatiens]
MTKRLILSLGALLLSITVHAADSVNILVYHHVANDTPASTTISPAGFREHLQLLRDNDFTVVSLTDAVAALRGDTSIELPEKAVAITFDDAYENIHTNAFPLLREFEAPFTVFAATDPIDQNFQNMMSWDQLRDLQDWGATVTNHSRDHDYMVRHSPLDDAWLQAMVDNVNHAQQRLTDELGADVPRWFAYPYGEYNETLKQALRDEGYVAFAQHSGGIRADSDWGALPRFAAAGVYANPETLITKLNSRPMPVNQTALPDMLTPETRPSVTVELTDPSDMGQALNCFVDSSWVDAEWLGEARFKVTAPEALSDGRHRFNCTSQARSGAFFYWFSQPWLVQTDR